MTASPGDPVRKSSLKVGLRIIILILVTGMGAYLVNAIKNAREVAFQSVCQSRLNQLQFALRNYHEFHGCFPPAYVADADGKPMHSWRVLILPFCDGQLIYNEYRFDEPWNSPHNLNVAMRSQSERYSCRSRPNIKELHITDYVAITGPGTAFPGTGVSRLEDFADGLENTILLAEIANSDILWTEPRDLVVDEMSFTINDRTRPSISGPHPTGPAVVFADSIRAYRIDKSLRPEALRALTTIAGGEPVSRDALIRPDYHPQTLTSRPIN